MPNKIDFMKLKPLPLFVILVLFENYQVNDRNDMAMLREALIGLSCATSILDSVCPAVTIKCCTRDDWKQKRDTCR